MNPIAKIVLIVAAIVAAVVPCQRLNADLRLRTIRAPQDCPEGLTIKTKAKDGVIEFDVSIDPEQVAHAGELYKGRVKANALLKIATPQEPIATVAPQGTVLREDRPGESRRTGYQFRLSASAAKSSELQLAVSLYEKDGMPTFGGGVSLQIYLAGFEPNAEDTDEFEQRPRKVLPGGLPDEFRGAPVYTPQSEEAIRREIEKRKLIEVYASKTGVDTSRTIVLLGKLNKVEIRPGSSVLVELPMPTKEFYWHAGDAPEGVGASELPVKFTHVWCRWEADGKLTWKCYGPSDPSPRPNAVRNQ